MLNQIIKEHNIIVLKSDLGGVDGYYLNVNGHKFVHLNYTADDTVLAREVIRAILFPNSDLFDDSYRQTCEIISKFIQ